MNNLVTPVDANRLEYLLKQSHYDEDRTTELVKGFKHGFEIGYEGNKSRQQYARNHTLRVGTLVDLWNKVMKEVQEKRYVGPLRAVPFKNFVQSPLGK